MHTFIENYDVLFLILMECTPATLLKVQGLSISLQSVVDDDTIWRRIVERDYGKEVTTHKPESETYKRQYRYLYTDMPTIEVIQDDRVDKIIAMKDTLKMVDIYYLSCTHGSLNVLRYLHCKGEKFTSGMVNKAAENCRPHVVSWFLSIGVLPTELGVDWIAGYGLLELLKKFIVLEIYPTHWGADTAASNGHLDTLKYLATLEIYPGRDGFVWALCNGKLEVLEWMCDELAMNPRDDDFIDAVDNNQWEVIKWLALKLIPTSKLSEPNCNRLSWIVGEACEKDNLDMMKWIHITFDFVPSERLADYAASQGKLEILKWLSTVDVHPSKEGILEALKNTGQGSRVICESDI